MLTTKKTLTIKPGKTFLMVKISTPIGISFLDEHQKLLFSKNYVWFCRFGKCSLLKGLISKDGNYLFVKESIKNGNNKYLLEFSEITTEAPVQGYPSYYDKVKALKSLWFKITAIYELPSDFESHFRLANTGNNLEKVYKSMCNSFYISCAKQFQI